MLKRSAVLIGVLLALATGNLWAQSADVSIEPAGKTLRAVLPEITKQTGVEFLYDIELLSTRVSGTGTLRGSVESVLDRMLENTGIRYTRSDNRIVLARDAAPEAPVRQAASVSSEYTLRGLVTDGKDQPLAGVTVIESSRNATYTGGDGAFTITVKPSSSLTFSYPGYVSQTIPVESRSAIEVGLEEDIQTLDEVIVVGYGTIKKRNLVGAVDQIDASAIENRPTSNLARSLQGEISGLNISFIDSKPSRSATFNVRGETSIGAGGSTLVLIDGVEGNLSAINPNDVETVSVLKDASSTAVYGARGAFGVILVTTKNPKKGVPTINYNSSVSINRRTVVPDLITDGLTWVNWWKDSYNGYYNGSRALLDHIDSTVPYSGAIDAELQRRKADPSLSKVAALEGHPMFGWAYYDSTDWFDLFYKDFNTSTEHNLSLSGGSDHADYYISGRYYYMNGIYRVGNESFNQYDVRAKGSLNIRPWFKITSNLSMSITDQYEPKHPRNNFNVQRAINHVGMPLSPVKNPDGSWTTSAAITGYASFVEGTSYRTNDHTYLRNKFSADINILKDVLLLQADYSYNYTARTRIDVQNPIKYSKKPGVYLLESESAGESLSQVEYDTNYQTANAYLTFTPNLGEKHDLTVLGGWNIENQTYKTLTVSRADFITANKPSFSLMNGVADNPVSGGNAWSYMGAFFRVNYSFGGKYLFEASGRYDGSSKFPVNSQWGFFPSASAAWVLSEEPWMEWVKNAKANVKLRLSAGSMGNGNVAPYSYTSEMSVATAGDIVIGGNYPSYTTVGATTPVSLTWEKATSYDIGLDMDFFNNRLSFSGDIYRRNTTNMYTVSVPLPSVYGTTPPKGNNGEMRTDGWELSLSWRNSFELGGKPFNYSVKATVWDNKSTITKYLNDTGTLGSVSGYIDNGGSPSSYYPGMTLGEIWGYTVSGLFKDQDDIDNSAIHNFVQASDKVTRPGQVKFADLDGNGYIDPGAFTVNDHGDLTIIGNQQARYHFGLNLSGSWNGIGLSVFLQGVGKRDWYPGSDAGYFWGKYGRPFFSAIPSIHNYTSDMYNEELDNWDTAYWPRMTSYQSNAQKDWTRALEIPNTRYIQKAAYVRVKNITVDYTFNERICRAIRMKGLKVYLSGENLFTYSPLHKYAPNFDPEGLSYDTDFAAAAEGYTYPILKSVTIGLNVTF